MSPSLRALRRQRGLSQQELARRSGLSRPEVSAVETGRVVPSVHAALALARALGVGVEALFSSQGRAPAWAFAPNGQPSRAWVADVGERRLAFPCEPGPLGLVAHDVTVSSGGEIPMHEPPPTLVVAGCDPAIGLLARALLERGVRVLALSRSSGAALDLLERGAVHVAGVHLGRARRGANTRAVHQRLGSGYRLLRWASWQEGLVTSQKTRIDAADTARVARLRWVGREPGSGARSCIEELFAGRRAPRFSAMARDHRGVGEAIRIGAADAGVCVRLAAEEAGLAFQELRTEAYDLCFRTDESRGLLDPLLSAVGDPRVRRLLSELPGYDVRSTGELSAV